MTFEYFIISLSIIPSSDFRISACDYSLLHTKLKTNFQKSLNKQNLKAIINHFFKVCFLLFYSRISFQFSSFLIDFQNTNTLFEISETENKN